MYKIIFEGNGPALSVLLLTLALTGCGESSAPKAQVPETVRGLRVETVRLQSVPDEIDAQGSIQSVRTAQLAAQVMARVTSVRVREGDAVKRGQVLILLDERELSARSSAAQAAVAESAAALDEARRGLAAAEAQADVAAKTYERYKFLRDQKSVSAQEFDEVEAKYRSTQAARDAARARLRQVEAAQLRGASEASAATTVAGYARITAPFDGVVVRRSVDPGGLAAPGMPLVTIEDASRYQAVVTFDAADAGAIRRGVKVSVRLDALPNREFEGTVAELEAGADPASHTVSTRIALPRDPALRSGLFVRAAFRRGERRALAIPRSAVVERGQLTAVYALDDRGLARLRIVTLGRGFNDRVEVLSGLGEGDRVVMDPGARELDGKKVEVSP
jgi:RND family efflux transporter MFP subunit